MRKFALALIVLAGCGGVAGTTLLVDLTAEDKTTVCEDEVAASEEFVVDCDGVELTVEAITQSECEDALSGMNDDCAATLDDYFDCADAIEADPCPVAIDFIFPAACDTYFDCFMVE